GLKVSRVPFNDHPARGPANIVGFVDRESRPSVLLAKYPSQMPGADGSSPEEQFRRAVKALDDEVAYLGRWGRKGLESGWREAFRTAWKDLERIETLPSPEWEEKRRIFEARGFRVVEVPLFAWGGGGLHCLALR